MENKDKDIPKHLSHIDKKASETQKIVKSFRGSEPEAPKKKTGVIIPAGKVDKSPYQREIDRLIDRLSSIVGVRVLSLGYAYLSSLGFATVARPIVEDLMRETGETCSIGVLDGDDVVYVVRVEVRRIVRMDLAVGARLPAYLNSMGRVLLAALPDYALDAYLDTLQPVSVTRRTVTDRTELRRRIVAVRRSGWCYINGEVEERVAGLSVPLTDGRGATVAALNVALMRAAYPQREVEAVLLPRLRAAAAQIEALLGRGLSPD